MNSSTRRKLQNMLALSLSMLYLASTVAAFSSPTVVDNKAQLFSGHTTSNNKFAADKTNDVTLTYLEINGWLLSTNGITILIDPILEGELDFGIPSLYQGKKRVLPSYGLPGALPPIDCILLTQGLDDHAHVRTLQKLQSMDPTVPIIAPPSAKAALKASGFWKDEEELKSIFNPVRQISDSFQEPQVRFLNHREKATIISRQEPNNSRTVHVRATEGALVGPPWQRRENGYLIQGSSSSSKTNGPSIYLEPHVEFNQRELQQLLQQNGSPDIVITPISGQTLPAFELVHGPKDTIRLVQTLQPKYLIPMQNGDIETNGPVSKFVSEVGSATEFQKQLQTSNLKTQLIDVVPGKDITISI